MVAVEATDLKDIEPGIQELVYEALNELAQHDFNQDIEPG